MNAFNVKPMKNWAFPKAMIPMRSASAEPTPVQNGPNNIPMTICGTKSKLTLKNGVSIPRKRVKTTMSPMSNPIVLIKCASIFLFNLSISLTSCYTKYAANAKTKPRTFRPSSKRQHPILLALDALFSTLFFIRAFRPNRF